MKYIFLTFCDGIKYEVILPHWLNRIQTTCKNCEIVIVNKNDQNIEIDDTIHAWWDVIRMNKIIEFLEKGYTVVHCDIDIIIQRDIEELLEIDADFIISKATTSHDCEYLEHYYNQYGFCICSGFFIAKPSSISFLKYIFEKMQKKSLKYITYETYSDQCSIMECFIDNNLSTRDIIYKNTFTNMLSNVLDVDICILDDNIIKISDELGSNSYGTHMNIDKEGGSLNFLRNFYNN